MSDEDDRYGALYADGDSESEVTGRAKKRGKSSRRASTGRTTQKIKKSASNSDSGYFEGNQSSLYTNGAGILSDDSVLGTNSDDDLDPYATGGSTML